MEKVSELIFESPSHGGSWIFGIAMSFVLSVIFTVTFFSKEEDVAGWIFVLLSLLSGFGLANILLSIWFPQKIVVSDGSLKVFRMHRYLRGRTVGGIFVRLFVSQTVRRFSM
jgi:hypothetical protein